VDHALGLLARIVDRSGDSAFAASSGTRSASFDAKVLGRRTGVIYADP
jgi:hypothetical protein